MFNNSNLLQSLLEMAYPTQSIKDKPYFHGTKSKEAAIKIAKEGLVPQFITNPKAALAPVKNKVYITPDVGYAGIYAIGGNIFGSRIKENSNEKGYIFQINGSSLKDVQPDEDSVGELYYSKKHPQWMDYLVNKHCTPNTIKKARDGEYSYWARLGKKIIPKMSDTQKLELIARFNTHIAHDGAIRPDKVFEIPHSKIHLVNRDGSNVLDHATEIPLSTFARI